MRKLLIDTDVGGDDAVALIMAGGSCDHRHGQRAGGTGYL